MATVALDQNFQTRRKKSWLELRIGPLSGWPLGVALGVALGEGCDGVDTHGGHTHARGLIRQHKLRREPAAGERPFVTTRSEIARP